METVLGLSVTSGRVGWVVLDGSGTGAASLDHDVVDVGGRPADDISRHIGAVRGAQAIAAASGQDLTSIGVTWTDDAAATADLVLRALLGLGFDKVVPVRLTDAGEHVESTLAWAAALAVASNVATVPLRLPRREPVVTAQTRRNSWLAPARAAAVLVAGLSALFVAGPEFAGQAEAPAPEVQSAADTQVAWESVYAVPVPAAAPSPTPVTVQLVAGRPAPAPITSYAVEEAAPEAAVAAVPETPASVEPVAVPHMPVQQVAAPSPVGGPAPGPAMPEPMPVMPPPVDPAQAVFSPLFSALP